MTIDASKTLRVVQERRIMQAAISCDIIRSRLDNCDVDDFDIIVDGDKETATMVYEQLSKELYHTGWRINRMSPMASRLNLTCRPKRVSYEMLGAYFAVAVFIIVGVVWVLAVPFRFFS